jgi:glutaconate CoA-transferase subunit A
MTTNVRPYPQLRKTIAQRDRSLRDKVMSLENAAKLVADGETVGIGGSMMSRTPMAMIWQLIRAGRRDLTCVRPITTSEGDLLLGSRLSRHVVTSWFSQGIMWGVSKVLRHHVETGQATFEEWSHLAIGMRLRAGAMGVPFMPMRPMLGSDIVKIRPEAREISCPFTGEKMLLVPALNPNLAIIHVNRCDAYGNAQIDGLQFMDVDLAMAADRVILTTERIVSNDQIRRTPDQTKIPFFCVEAVVEVPFGSAPHECYGVYEPLMNHMNYYTGLVNKDPVGGLKTYLDEYVHAPSSWNDYLNRLGMDELLEAARRGRSVLND